MDGSKKDDDLLAISVNLKNPSVEIEAQEAVKIIGVLTIGTGSKRVRTLPTILLLLDRVMFKNAETSAVPEGVDVMDASDIDDMDIISIRVS